MVYVVNELRTENQYNSRDRRIFFKLIFVSSNDYKQQVMQTTNTKLQWTCKYNVRNRIKMTTEKKIKRYKREEIL